MQALLDLLDAGGLSLGAASARLGLSEGQALAMLVGAGRTVRIDGAVALAAVRTWGRIRVILRSRSCVAEVMSDLGAVRESGVWWNDEDERVHLHLNVGDVATAFVTTKAGHASGRAVRTVAFVDTAGEVLFKVMVPKERPELIPAFNALKDIP
ncbi:MAG: ChuX/HutX family heme-like substrate-binding protein [Pseudomonadota bacterium]|nr:ChuX/HutX family heme-like substrate-binding protein [Pseudomonadota bacterium]